VESITVCLFNPPLRCTLKPETVDYRFNWAGQRSETDRPRTNGGISYLKNQPTQRVKTDTISSETHKHSLADMTVV